MLSSGRTEEALEYLLSALSSVLDKHRELELLVEKLRRERVGKRSEKLDPKQLALLFEALASQGHSDDATEVDPAGEGEANRELKQRIEEARKDELPADKGRKGKRGKVKLRDVQRVHHRREVPEAERRCESCGKDKSRIGEDLSRTLEYVPAHFVEHVHHLDKYACRSCKDGVATAKGPVKVLERSPAGASLLAHVVVAKYADHTPLHRQRKIYKRSGVLLGVSTLSDWVAGVADLVEPIVERLAERVLGAYVVGTDATGLKVLDPSSPANVQRGTIWCYLGDERDVLFRYAPTGEGATGPWDFLAGRKGYIQADAASVFDRLFNGEIASASEVGCWGHGRRRLYAMKDTDCRVAYPLQLIARLFLVEQLADARRLDPDERVALRRERSVEALDKLKRWLVVTHDNEPPSTDMAKATAYPINHWIALTRFLEDGRLRLDNNLVEQQLRDIALGRKNFLFAGSHDAAHRAARLYSLMRTCELHEVPQLLYLTDILQRLAGGWPARKLDELLPDRWLELHADSMVHPLQAEPQ